MSRIKAISLISGGLDSTLATKIIVEQGVEVLAINFLSPFCLCNKKGGCRYEAGEVSKNLGIELKTVAVFNSIPKFLETSPASYLQPPFLLHRQKGLKKFMAKTSTPCSTIILVARVLSNPPEIKEIAFILLIIYLLIS